MVEPSGEFMK